MIYDTSLLAQGASNLPLDPGIWAFLGVLVTAVLGYLGAHLQRRAREKGTEASVIVATGQEYRELIKAMRDELDRVGNRVDCVEESLDETKQLLHETATKLHIAERRLTAWQRFGQMFIEWITQLPEELRASAPRPPD